MSTLPSTYYQQLGLDPQASLEEIKTAYRQRARQVHPDSLPAETPEYLRQLAQREFLQLQRAYRVLSDSQQRRAYDLSLKGKPSPPRPVVVTVAEPAPSCPGWLTLLSAGLTGAAVCLLGLAAWHQLSPVQSLEMSQKMSLGDAPASAANSEPTPTISPVSSSRENVTSPAEPADRPETMAPVPPSEVPFQPSAEQINRFARALLQLQPLLEATQNRLQQANSSEEQQQIEQEFENAATKVIVANQLTPEEYQRISASAQSDPQVAASVTAAVRRWRP